MSFPLDGLYISWINNPCLFIFVFPSLTCCLSQCLRQSLHSIIIRNEWTNKYLQPWSLAWMLSYVLSTGYVQVQISGAGHVSIPISALFSTSIIWFSNIITNQLINISMCLCLSSFCLSLLTLPCPHTLFLEHYFSVQGPAPSHVSI